MQDAIRFSPSLKRVFRVTPTVFERITAVLSPKSSRQHTHYRIPMPPELRIAPFILVASGHKCEAAANQIGIVESKVSSAVHEVSRNIVKHVSDETSFPTYTDELGATMAEFKKISCLP